MAGFIRKFFTRLTSKYPRADLVVLQLMNTIEGMTRADRVASPTHPLSLITGKPKVLMCSEVLRVLKFGKAHNLYPDADSDTIDRAQKIMSEFIEVFESEVEMIQERRGPYEDFNGRFLYVAKELRRMQDNLAADCTSWFCGTRAVENMLWGHMKVLLLQMRWQIMTLTPCLRFARRTLVVDMVERSIVVLVVVRKNQGCRQ